MGKFEEFLKRMKKEAGLTTCVLGGINDINKCVKPCADTIISQSGKKFKCRFILCKGNRAVPCHQVEPCSCKKYYSISAGKPCQQNLTNKKALRRKDHVLLRRAVLYGNYQKFSFCMTSRSG